ncbi:MAG: hypothetical protein NXH91_03495 [Phyllobacteriaceae bacterium]|nr:hypothetical protein [Phyllobacteriaceae bacterium]
MSIGEHGVCGTVRLRTPFVQAAHIILMRPHNWSTFSFGSWLETAYKRKQKTKLAVALANKLARIARSNLSNERTSDTHRTEASAV